MIVNANANIGVAKEGTDDPVGKKQTSEDAIDDYLGINELFDEDGLNLNWILLDPDSPDKEKKEAKIKVLTQNIDDNFDWSRPLNPDKDTSANAGGINLNLAVNDVKAYVKDGATLNSNQDINVNALSKDLVIDTNAVVSANGKSGSGATIMADISKNTVEAIIGRANVDANGALNITAKENYNLIAASAGIAAADNKAGAGNVSSAVQVNNVTAAINEGANVNNNVTSSKQSVKVEGAIDSHVIKAVGALAVQHGGKAENSAGSVGGTIDGDIVVNEINAYIKGAVVNATNAIDVNANNEDFLIVVDVAGSASTQSTAYGGTIGAYVAANDVNSYIENSNINLKDFGDVDSSKQQVNVNATSSFESVDVVGTIAAGKKTGAGASIRTDVIANDINSYIKDSNVKANDSVIMTNYDSISQISVAVAGAGSTNNNAGAGVISLLANVTEQNNYIENSDLNVGSLLIDSDKVLKTIAVTGAIAAATQGHSLGLSAYGIGVSHDINTYIKNSSIISSKDIKLTSDFSQESLNIIFGGAGGSGFAGSGAISVVVNNSNMNTYVLADSDSEKNELTSNDGKVTIKSESNINLLTVDGNVAISTSNSSAGAAVNTYVNNADITAGIDGATIAAKKGVDVLAESTQSQTSIVVGAAGGSETSAQGSIDTIVIAQNMDAYIKNATVEAGGDVKVRNEDILNSGSVTGALSVSSNNLAVGASVLTATIGGQNIAHIDNSTFDDYNIFNSLGDLIVESTQSDSFTSGTLAGSAGSKAGVGGAIDTIVLNKTVSAYIDNVDNINDSEFKNITINANPNTDLSIIAGSLSVGGNVGVGGTVSTVVINKHIHSFIQNDSNVEADKNISVKTNAEDDVTVAAVAGSGGGSYSVSGVVNTTVINSDMQSGIKNSTVNADKITVDTLATAHYDDISGAVSGAGTVGVGASITTNVIGYDLASYVDNSIVKQFGKLNVNAQAISNYDVYAISGAGGGTAGIAGVVETNVVNNTITAYVLGDIDGDELTVNALDTVNFNGMAGSLAGGATAGVGATISTNSVTSTILAYIGSTNEKHIKANDITVKAQGIQNFNNLLAMGFGGGQVGVGGSSLANIVDATVKSYIKENSSIESASNLKIEANDSTSITGSVVAGAGAQYVAGGASVGVNKITNTVEAYTENHVNLKLSKSEINATSITNLGTKDNKLYIAAGTAAAGGAATGAVLVNTVENNVNANIGKKNNINSTGDLILKAQADTNIYESVGGVAIGGVAGVGASVGVNNIDNTVNTLIGVDSVLNMPSGNLTLEAHSNEIIDATASIVGGGSVALSGGIIHNTIGKVVDNAQENALTGDDATVYETAKTQAENVLIASANELNNADKNYKEYSGTNTESTFSLFTKSENSGSSLGSTARLNTTSAFIDSEAKLNTKDTSLYAKNTNDVDIKVSGNTYGAAAVGVSAGVSNIYTTTNAFVSNNVVIDSTGGINISSESVDNQDINVKSASGGIISGSGGLAKINSNKTTNTYVLSSSVLEAIGDLLLDANSKGIVNSTVNGDSHGGVAVGVSVADAIIKGNTKIDIEDNVDLLSKEGNLTITANTEESSTADADALSGSLVGGVGAEANAQTGKTNTINIGKNANVFAKLAAKISSIGKNTSIAKTDGRAYGVVSAGGTMTNAIINNNGGVNIADADKNSGHIISGKSIEIISTEENSVDAQTRAGAGAVIGVGGSGVYTNIDSSNNIKIGNNYSITTSDGGYSVIASSLNKYKSYNDSSAYGVVGVSAGIIGNTINSIVNVESNADIIAHGAIEVLANNEVKKDAATNYDLYGGAGGVVGVGAASLTDDITMSTFATLAGNKAYSTGAFKNGFISVSSLGTLDVNEKVDVTAGGAVPVAEGNVQVKSNVETTTNIKNKDIQTKDDNIYFLANNKIDINTKSNVSSYGGIAVADGESIAQNNSAISSVIISSGVNSISGRDTEIQASCDKDIQASIYATTQGLIGLIGDSSALAYNNSYSNINIEKDANLKSYDSMNLIATDDSSNFDATRVAEASILIFIPITIRGEGNETKTNSHNALITLNGNLESGLGANRSLVINSDGTYESKGINVIGKEQVGEITATDVQSDIDAYELTKNNKLAEVDDYISIENGIITNAQNSITEAQTQKVAYESKNQEYTNAINIANNIIENNNTIKETQAEVNVLNSVNEAWESAYSKSNNVVTIDDSFGFVLQEYADNNNIENIQSAWELYSADKSSTNLLALQNSINDMLELKSTKENNINNLNSTNTTLATTVNAINTQVDCSNNTELVSFITEINEEIVRNNNSISICNDAINASSANISAARNEIAKADAEKAKITEYYNSVIQELNNQKELAEDASIPVYSLLVDNIIVRSGDTTLTGKVEGNGTITAPGNKFTVDIVNNSPSDIVYKNIQIGRNVSGLINGSNIASTITKNILNNTNEYSISILNTVDANDPTIDLNVKNGFGDMVFNGNIENVNGLVKFINYTGNILSEGSITAKDLKISVPNGSYAQTYSDNTVTVGGSSGNGAIVASGDIDIASKIIDINGLIQSGSEIKSITIPDFKVVKENGVYYQVMGDSKVAMQKGASDGYYYLNLSGNGQLDSDLEMVKAYFKPLDETNANNVLGNIHLFKAEIQGGNITLTGNIISTSDSGKIVLVNGYGHIDIQNDSNFNLVTSALNADANITGKLTINDIKFLESDKGGKAFDSLKQEDIENATWLSENTGTYTANVDSQGNIITSTKGQTEGNGTWGTASSTTRADGANIDTITYTPGADAYYVTKAGSTEVKSYTEYVKRSWWTELWYGKLYRTVYYTVTHNPEYGVAQNNITVQFQGFDTPQINVTSNGSIVLNNSISALTGNVDLTSNNGSITLNNINNVISASNINLSAKNDIGTDLKPIQAAIYNNGILNVGASNAYINYPTSDISNVIVNVTGNAYLATSGAQLGSLDSTININADSLELRADNGSIQLDSTKNDKITINVNKLKARANGSISLTNKNNLNVSSIVSTSKGNITLGSENGSIVAVSTETLNPYHIDGGNIIINALNGYIGTNDSKLKIARDGIIKVNADKDINIASAGRMFIDSIQSKLGKVNLNADYGIIAAENTTGLAYNIFAATGVDLNTKYGNIENIAINTDGVINAIAGYNNGIASGMSDINISLISKQKLSQEYLATLATEEEKEVAVNNYINGLKDMKLGNIKASKNIFINAEKSILNSDNNSSLTGSQIVLSATNGDIGTSDSAINLNASRDITAFAGNNKNVYLTSDGNLNINEVRSLNSYDSATQTITTEGVLNNVVLSAKGNISNASSDNKVNITAQNIDLHSTKDIGSNIKYLNINTPSNILSEGLKVTANNAYINGIGADLNIISSEITNNIFLSTTDVSLTIQNSNIGNSLVANSSIDTNIVGSVTAVEANINSNNETIINNGVVSGSLNNTSNNIVINNAELDTLTTSSTTANIVDMTVTGNTSITTTEKSTIANATVGGDFVNNSTNTEVTDKLVVTGNSTITASDSIVINNAELDTLTTSSTTANIVDMTVTGNTSITTTEKSTIANATVGGDFVNNSTNTEVTDKLIANNVSINSSDSIIINDANIQGDLNVSAKNINVNEILLSGNVNANVDNLSINTSNDLNIGKIAGNSNIYSSKVSITSDESIYNGLTDGGTNLQAKDINIKANEMISTLDKPLNITLSNGNKLSLASDKWITLSTNGAGANYTNLETKAFALYTDEAVNIDTMKVEEAKIVTSSNNLSIDNLSVGNKAEFVTANKNIIVDNSSLKPIINADVQLHLTQFPASLKVDGSNNIITEVVNVARHNNNILVNSDNHNNSMNGAINSSSMAAIKNTNVEKSYGQGFIKNHIDEYISPSNIFDVINNSKSKTSKIKYFHKISYDNIKYKKVSAL